MVRKITEQIRYSDDLSLEPLAKDVERYSFGKLRRDLMASLSLAMLSVPQALAYSIVAGVPPVAGVVSMVLGTLIAALLSSSSHLVIGPNNATSLLVQAAAIQIMGKFYATQQVSTLQVITFLTLLIGSFQLLAALFKLGRLIQFVSYSVVVGYITGTALAIGVGQLFPLTGMQCPIFAETVYQKFVYWISHVGDLHLLTTIVGTSSIILAIVLCHFRRRLPPALIMLSAMTLIVYLLGLSGAEDREGRSLQLLGCGEMHFVPFEAHFFDFQLIGSLIPIAFAIALIGMLEANAIAKSVSVTSGQRINGNQEIFALGCANFFLSFFSGLPCSGSASRTTANVDYGAATRFSAIIAALFVALFAFGLSSIVQYVPRASLAALLMVTAFHMIDVRQILLCWSTTKSDAFVAIVTLFSCFFFSLPLALYIGVALSIILYLRKAAIPHVSEYVYEESIEKFRPATEEERKHPRSIRLINVEGELFFGSMDLFQYSLRAIAKDDHTTKVFILRLKHVHDLDVTAVLALKQLKDYLFRYNQLLVVCSVPKKIFRLFERSRLTTYLGAENIIMFDERAPHTDLSHAYARARELLQEQGSSLAYEIGAFPVIQPNLVTIPVSAIADQVVEQDPTL